MRDGVFFLLLVRRTHHCCIFSIGRGEAHRWRTGSRNETRWRGSDGLSHVKKSLAHRRRSLYIIVSQRRADNRSGSGIRKPRPPRCGVMGPGLNRVVVHTREKRENQGERGASTRAEVVAYETAGATREQTTANDVMGKVR